MALADLFKKAKKKVDDYLAPTPQVRTRDFVREAPQAIKTTVNDFRTGGLAAVGKRIAKTLETDDYFKPAPIQKPSFSNLGTGVRFRDFVRELPAGIGKTEDNLAQGVVRTGLSAYEAPEIIRNKGKVTPKWYNTPVGRVNSFQSEQQNRINRGDSIASATGHAVADTLLGASDVTAIGKAAVNSPVIKAVGKKLLGKTLQNEAKDIVADAGLKVAQLARPYAFGRKGSPYRSKLVRSLSRPGLTIEDVSDGKPTKPDEDFMKEMAKTSQFKRTKEQILEGGPEKVAQAIANVKSKVPEQIPKEEADAMAGMALYKSEDDKSIFQNIFKKWIGKREAAVTRGVAGASKFKGIGDDVSEEVIRGIENPSLPVSPKAQVIMTEFRAKDDELFKIANENGLDVRYLKNHVAHIWDKPQDEVEEIYKIAKQKYGFSNSRTIPTYEEGIQLGLVPKYTNPAQILAEQERKMNETIANVELLNDLKREGLVVPASVGSRMSGFLPLNGRGFARSISKGPDGATVIGQYYAPADIAQEINHIFEPERISATGRVAIGAGNISSGLQDLLMSGGVPKTPINAFTFAQMTKEVLSGRLVSPVMSLLRGSSGYFAKRFFQKNVEQIIKMQERNIPISTEFDITALADKGFFKNAFGETVGEAWHKSINEPTFKRFMPMLQINLFNDIESKLVASGKSAEDAADTAADVVKNFYGVITSDKRAMRSKAVEGVTSAALFAPRYREAMMHFWKNNALALVSPTDPKYRQNLKFMLGAALAYAGYDYINQKLNGRHMWENPGGKEDKLLIPLDDGKVLGVPYLSSIATLPRLGYRVGKDLIQGDINTAGKDVVRTMGSMALKPFAELAMNENYFGSEIYDPNATTEEKYKDMANYILNPVTGAYGHPWLRTLGKTETGNDVMNTIGLGKKNYKAPGTGQLISEAMESPLRFYSEKSISSGYYRDAEKKALKGLDEKGRKAYTMLHDSGLEKYDENGLRVPTDRKQKMQNAIIRINNPEAFDAERKIAIDTAKKTGEPMSPIYKLQPWQAQILFRLDSLPPGDEIYGDMVQQNIKWLKPFWNERSAFYDGLKKSGKLAESGTTVYQFDGKSPVNYQADVFLPSPQIQALQDKYFTLPDGTGAKKAFLAANPALTNWWDVSKQRKIQDRILMGYSYDDLLGNGFGSGSGGGKKKGEKPQYGNIPFRDLDDFLIERGMEISPKAQFGTKAHVSGPTFQMPSFKEYVKKQGAGRKVKSFDVSFRGKKTV